MSNDTIDSLRLQVLELTRDNEALQAQLDGDMPKATAWLQRKVWRQGRALDALNRRVLTQRFVLRTVEQLGRGLTKAELDRAKAELTPDLQARLLEEVA